MEPVENNNEPQTAAFKLETVLEILKSEKPIAQNLRLLALHNVMVSMRGAHICWDNAAMESFFSTPKAENDVNVYDSNLHGRSLSLITSKHSIIACVCTHRSVTEVQRHLNG